MMKSRILVGLIAGTLGGFLGWLFQEHLIDYNAHVVQGLVPGQAIIRQGLSQNESRLLVLCVGGLIGMFLGAVDGIVEGSGRKLAVGIAGGALAGIFLGSIGFQLGMIAFNVLGGGEGLQSNAGLLGFIRQVIARSFGWALMGLGLGAGSAIVTRSPQRIGYGAIGGFLGGFLGGFVFDILATGAGPVETAVGTSGPRDVGGPSRMVGFTLIGGLTGFFTGLVEELFKQAWVKVLAGRNEGKDYTLYKSMNLLGRDERCDVPLFGDNAVGVQHAAIRSDGRRHFLIAAATPSGTLVNGQTSPPGTELLLRDGDMIQIGAHRIQFREKATASRLTQPNQDRQQIKQSGPAAVPIPAHLCAFCGSPRDSNGNCQCTLGTTSPGLSDTGSPGAYMPFNPVGSQSMPPAMGVASMGGGMETPYGPPQAIGQLVGIEGPYMGQVFSLSGANMEVGRDAGKAILLASDTTISRSHARLIQQNGTLQVVDNNSSNGTYVNGQRVFQAIQLMPGDVVQFGSSKFRCE